MGRTVPLEEGLVVPNKAVELVEGEGEVEAVEEAGAREEAEVGAREVEETEIPFLVDVPEVCPDWEDLVVAVITLLVGTELGIPPPDEPWARDCPTENAMNRTRSRRRIAFVPGG